MHSYPRPCKLINPTIGTRPDQPLCQGSGLTLLHRVEGDSPCGGSIDVQRSIHLHQFALICIYAACKKHKYTQINMENIYIGPIYMFSRLHICIYALSYTHIWQYIPFAFSPHYHSQHIYIYICSDETQKYHVQATSAAGSCSQHSIMIHQSPPEATIGFYQETS